MSVSNVFRKVFEFMTVQWYFDQVDPDSDVIWDPMVYFISFKDLVANGKGGNVMDTSTYIRKVLNYLLAYTATQEDKDSMALTQALEEINAWPDLGSAIHFPSIVGVGTDSVVMRLPYSIDSSCKALTATFLTPDSMTNSLKNFYRDYEGMYTLDGIPKTMQNACCTNVTSTFTPVTKTINGTAHTLGQYVDIDVKMSFMIMLRQFVEKPSVLQGLSMQSLKGISVGESIPIPANGKAQDMGCNDTVGYCNCLYYCAFGPFECPGYGYYYCQFYDQCKCVVSRAVPFHTSLKDRINNKFGMCFDLNCADEIKRPDDCQDQCTLAKEWLTTPNWAEDFINAAALNIDLIEKTCGFKVPQFSLKSNAYFWTWEVVAGGVCMLLTVPVLVGMESWRKQKFSLRFIHILAFLFLLALVIVFGYAVVGVQECGDVGVPNQSSCMDRLTKTIEMSHRDCDKNNPMFCQCDASRDILKPCIELGMETCKCQNNQLCMPGGGNDDIVQPAPATKKRLRWQLLYFCMGLYVLVSTLIGVGVYYMTNRHGQVGWVPTISLGLNVVLHLAIYIFLFALIVIFPVAWKYVKELDQTMEVNVTRQGQLCIPSS